MYIEIYAQCSPTALPSWTLSQQQRALLCTAQIVIRHSCNPYYNLRWMVAILDSLIGRQNRRVQWHGVLEFNKQPRRYIYIRASASLQETWQTLTVAKKCKCSYEWKHKANCDDLKTEIHNHHYEMAELFEPLHILTWANFKATAPTSMT